MSANIPQSVLSDALQDAIAGRRVKAAVFLTFQFDPAFFEEEILPLLFTQSFSHIAKVRIVQLEEALRAVDHIAVHYDRQGLTSDAQPARLDYRRIGLARPTGVFHPKNILLLLENQDKDQSWESLLVVTLSANLTRSGWWENVETAHFMEVHTDEGCSYRDDLLELISRIKREDRIEDDDHAALEVSHAFLLHRTYTPNYARKNGRWLPRVYAGLGTVPEFLAEFTSRDTFNLEVISPYFDSTASALLTLIDTVQPKAVRIFLPKDRNGVAQCTPAFNEALQQHTHVDWGLLPEELLSQGPGGENGIGRFVHAKVYRFWNQQREILFIGSVNLTHAAHSQGIAGNFETGVLVESEPSGQRTWWLKSQGDNVPEQFHPGNVEDVETDAAVGNVSFQFDWKNNEFQYFWESRSGDVHGHAALSMQGVEIGEINPIRFDAWLCLPDECALHVKRQLASTSFVDVSVDGAASFRILVREEQMAQKPSILLALTSEEILQYWSLLSPEQREVLLINKILTLPGGAEVGDQTGTPLPPMPHGTLFDRFAGIFHAFDRMEVHLNDALTRGHESEAIYRLFGQKYDSLPSLIDKIVQGESGDRVNRYVSLLCAQQLISRVRDGFPDFAAQHRDEMSALRQQLEAIDQIRAGFAFDTPEQREQFFGWFERMFSTRLASAIPEANA